MPVYKLLIKIFSVCIATFAVISVNQNTWNDFLYRPSKLTQIVLSEMKPNYEIGLGRVDITGPAADVNMVRNIN